MKKNADWPESAQLARALMSSLWRSRLDLLAKFEVGVGILGNGVGVPFGVNVAIAFWTILSASNSNLSPILYTGLVNAWSIIADIILLSTHGGEWSAAGYGFGMALLIIVLMSKAVSIFVMYQIHEEEGGGRSEYTSVDSKEDEEMTFNVGGGSPSRETYQ